MSPCSLFTEYHCHGQWESDGVTYVVASPVSRASNAPRRVCFAIRLGSSTGSSSSSSPQFHDTDDTLTLTARHDTCIQQQHDAHIAINATLQGMFTLDISWLISEILMTHVSKSKVIVPGGVVTCFSPLCQSPR